MNLRHLVLAATSLLLLTAASVHAEDAGSDQASYEFLRRQATLQFDYGKFDAATASLLQACATPEGRGDYDCWRRLASAAEKAGRVGVAVDAWESAVELPGGDAAEARRELKRLRAAFGSVRLGVPPGRSLPTWPGVLGFEGLLIDPALKAYVAAVQARVAEAGFDADVVWLPAGEYRFGDLAFEVVAGRQDDLQLPAGAVPYRSAAFRSHASAGPGVMAGPFEVGVAASAKMGGVPGGGLGLGLATVEGIVRFGRRAGPVRMEAGLRVGATPVRSTSAPGGDRDGAASHVLGQLDVGVDLALGGRALLTPHASLVGGTVGEVLVGCRTVQASSGHAWDGECRAPTVALGPRAGVDLTVGLDARGRLALRIGLAGEALVGGVTTNPGDRLAGSLGVDLIKMDRWRFTWMRGGLDVGLSVRF